MYQLLVFIHVISAIFLGSFLVLPWMIKTIFSRTGDEFIGFLRMALSFLRSGHYALIFLMVSGGWMVTGYSAFPSILWVSIAVVLLLLIGALMGMILKTLKKIIKEDYPSNHFAENLTKLRTMSWVMFLTILIAVLIMTNPNLLNV
ncbi:hypothetical protein ABE28_010355 [Peribacillus muralis]|uniref:DUF2269 domain-containing protein n=1 Tax=Peribacillus muralis TaxID=264697 RepID=A0A1B3XNG8_9BACI|nr:hypothetical protein [Peribacillus muralis]AOH54752.1 hypothetical protein ABE28_010355 [Peribacillus muralis]